VTGPDARRPPRSRVALAGMVTAACLLTLFGRLVDLQVAERPAYAARSEANRARVIEREAPRGRILDRAGRVLADTGLAYRVTLDRSMPAGKQKETLARLARLTGQPEPDLAARLGNRRLPALWPAPVVDDAAEDVVVALRERPEELPGVTVESYPRRRYPYGTLAAHVLGTLGDPGSDQHGGRRSGASGVEARHDAELSGTPGARSATAHPNRAAT
jgi:penicillin-binding protein 2